MARNYAAWLESTRLLAACRHTRNIVHVKMDLHKSKALREEVNATSGCLFLRAGLRPKGGWASKAGRDRDAGSRITDFKFCSPRSIINHCC